MEGFMNYLVENKVWSLITVGVIWIALVVIMLVFLSDERG